MVASTDVVSWPARTTIELPREVSSYFSRLNASTFGVESTDSSSAVEICYT
jgi:hypothetical protein